MAVSQLAGAAHSVPFITTFATLEKSYVYDVNSNVVFECHPAEAEIARRWRRGMRTKDVLPALRDRFSEEAAGAALTAVRKCARRGYFSPRRSPRFGFHENEKRKGAHALASQLSQLILGVTEDCNLRCRYCVYGGTYEHYRPHVPRRMSVDTALKAVDFFLARSSGAGDSYVSFYGGEPLLSLELIRTCVEHVEVRRGKRRVRYNLTSNGVLLSDAAVDFLVEHDFAPRISLDGPQELHDANRVDRGGRGSFARVARNLSRLAERHPRYRAEKVSLSIVLGWPYDAEKAMEYFDTDDLIEGLSIEVNAVYPFGTDYYERFPMTDAKGYEALENEYVRQMASDGKASPFLAGMFDRRMKNIAQRPIDRPIDEVQHPNAVCQPGVRRLFVNADGRFQPCERFNDTISIGDIERGFDEDAIRRLTRSYVATCLRTCGDCWARRLCTACYTSANADGISQTRKDAFCENERQTILRSLTVYFRILERNRDAFDRLRQTPAL